MVDRRHAAQIINGFYCLTPDFAVPTVRSISELSRKQCNQLVTAFLLNEY